MGQVIPMRAARLYPPLCMQCGAETDWPEFGVDAVCPVCDPSEPETRPEITNDLPGDVIIGDEAIRAVEELSAVTDTAATRIIREILALEKRILSLMAFLPIVGPWWLHESEHHTPAEKLHLSTLSVAVTIVAVFGFLSLLPTTYYYSQQIMRRVDGEIRVLRDVAEDYRALQGRYPDEAMWRRFASRADPRFFDPWGRPYRYHADDDTGLTIGSLGRDGVERGRGDRADLWVHFPPAVKVESAKRHAVSAR